MKHTKLVTASIKFTPYQTLLNTMKMRSIIMFLISALLITTAVSCVGKIDPQKPDIPNVDDKEDEDDKEDVTPKIISFSFLKKNNPSLNSDIEFKNIAGNKYCAYLDAVKDASSLIASFELSNGQLLIGDVVQESGKTANNFTNVVTYKYKQGDGKVTEWKMTLVPYTGMPLLFITIADGKMPTNKVDWKKASLKSVDIKGDYDYDNMVVDIRLRGNSTMSYPKKPFNIKLSEKTSIFGMPKHKRWSLLANYRDKSLLRNYVAFHIGQNLKIWNGHLNRTL